MQELRKERLIIALIILAQIGFIIEILLSDWEPMSIVVIGIGILAMIWVHLTQKVGSAYRITIYFVLASLSIFFMVSHEDGLINPAVLIILLITSFSLFNKPYYLNIGYAEYILILIYRMIVFGLSEGNIGGYSIYSVMAYFAILTTVFALCHLSVSDKRMTREEIEKLNSTVEKNQNDIGDFLSNVSHELRTPVNVIGGMSTLTSKDVDIEEYQNMKEACVRLTHQIDDIQDYTEVVRDEVIINENDYMCDSLLRDVVSYYKSVDRKKNLEFIVDLAPDTPSMLRGDIEKLHKLFRHLIDNAMKFTKKGGIYLKVYARPREYGANLIIEVTDTGIGMSRAQISMLSTGMYQANKKRNRSTGGIGLGYTIIYGFVRKMGGFVKIESDKGRGTKVHLSIPQKVIDKTPCMSITNENAGDILYYTDTKSIQVPEIREYNRAMAANLAAGIGVHLYATADKKEFTRLLNELNVTNIFTTEFEYDSDSEFFDKLAKDNYIVTASTDEDCSSVSDKGVLFIPKPLCGSDIVRIINGEYKDLLNSKSIDLKTTFTGVRALVVDDEPMNLVVATGIFKEYGLIVDTAESGPEAINKYKERDYDIVFMDHMMPEMDGVEAMKIIKEIARNNNRKTVIVALTANVLSGAREMFIKEGFDGFLAKPINVNEFVRVLKKTLPDDVLVREGRD